MDLGLSDIINTPSNMNSTLCSGVMNC